MESHEFLVRHPSATTADFNGDGELGEGHDYRGVLFACAFAADAGTGEDDVSEAVTLSLMEANSIVDPNGDSLDGYTNGTVEAAISPRNVSANSFFEATSHVGAVASAMAPRL